MSCDVCTTPCELMESFRTQAEKSQSSGQIKTLNGWKRYTSGQIQQAKEIHCEQIPALEALAKELEVNFNS